MSSKVLSLMIVGASAAGDHDGLDHAAEAMKQVTAALPTAAGGADLGAAMETIGGLMTGDTSALQGLGLTSEQAAAAGAAMSGAMTGGLQEAAQCTMNCATKFATDATGLASCQKDCETKATASLTAAVDTSSITNAVIGSMTEEQFLEGCKELGNSESDCKSGWSGSNKEAILAGYAKLTTCISAPALEGKSESEKETACKSDADAINALVKGTASSAPAMAFGAAVVAGIALF